MESRREFLKKAAVLSGASMWATIPASIQRALAIDPALHSTFLDAEHIVILMQENRSFDHCYGTLQGVRGYNDPRAHVLPNGNPVWLQTNADGETYAPFRLDIKETNATWMGSLPHSWSNQVDARNNGHYDKWLVVKPTGYKGFEKKPMTLGHYTRDDVPFYYAFADAFTVCDQHFCSSLTGTTPNRLYLWTGTIRPKMSADSKPHVYNEEADYDHEVSWTTFPERLEDAGVSWKIYQNELSIETGFEGEEEEWLANFGDNPIEYFTQYNVRHSPRHRAWLDDQKQKIAARIDKIETGLKLGDLSEAAAKKAIDELTKLKSQLKETEEARAKWSIENWEKLSAREKSIHAKAFTVNENDPHFHSLETLAYGDDGVQRTVQVPKGDVFDQFRKDVNSGQLPTVSWIVGPQNFSDHPSSAWYGAWYVSEALDILTQNPEVWKKTIFILTYDENDGYFDHVPPFVAPNPHDLSTGKVSTGIDAVVEFVTKEQDKAFRPDYKPRESSIGLGYRVPFVVASPWSRGGAVCSQVFDATSVLQFLEVFLTHKTGKKIAEPNITTWRRTVCGDLTSVFQPFHGGPTVTPPFPKREEFIESIHQAQFKKPPQELRALTPEQIESVKHDPKGSPFLTTQEPGTRVSLGLPYELYVDGSLSHDGQSLEVSFHAGKKAFGKHAAGSPFNAYAYQGAGAMKARSYAVSAGHTISDHWPLAEFVEGSYHVRIDGPNGFLREFKGHSGLSRVEAKLTYAMDRHHKPTGEVEVTLTNSSNEVVAAKIADQAYGTPPLSLNLPPKTSRTVKVATTASHGWYDLEVQLDGADGYQRRFAGRVETGKLSRTDPVIGRESADR